MLADIHILYQSDFYKITDFKCLCDVCSVSAPEYNDAFYFSFIRKGFFEYRTFRRKDEVHTGRILLSKPGFEHTTMHLDKQPDVTTVFEFRKESYEKIKEQYSSKAEWFFNNHDLHCVLLNSNAPTEYIHFSILNSIKSGKSTQLEIDEKVLALLENAMGILTSKQFGAQVPDMIRKHHLATGESAREYMQLHFAENISLNEIADHCHVSAFHFSRIFKSIFQTSPHQYLTAVRLQHAQVLLLGSEKQVAEIAYECGFNSPEHFVTAYKQKFNQTPSTFRHLVS
jgi:AraC family transcriptional regulator